ncbi:unnamed protein product [Phytophthora fragariaefolia]|uniref:Unnamed protein product n=1 Tax=Phytophthora fragariaefolia TaxID=1490495 RepID=A0A9W6YPJ7_9STRA|nr:unnamed protein product [Phytophthora fragariaefolia]
MEENGDAIAVAASSAQNAPAPTTTSSDAMSKGAIAGVVIGCAVFVAAVVGSVLYHQKLLARQREESLFADLSDTGFDMDYTAIRRRPSIWPATSLIPAARASRTVAISPRYSAAEIGSAELLMVGLRKGFVWCEQSYMEGSMWHAVMVDELVWVGGFSSPLGDMEGVLKTFGFRFPVGCQTKETGLFITQKENGIMGLGRHRSTVMAYMLSAGRVTQNVFTLCFDGNGGELVFGGVDYSHHTSNVGYTPLLNDNSAYYPVHVKNILLNGASLGIDAGTLNSGRGVIVDSGTTDTFFDGRGKRAFMKAFSDAAGRDYSEKRMKLSSDELATLPVISIILSGMKGDGTDDVQLDVPASKYLSPSDDGGSRYLFLGKGYANATSVTPVASVGTSQPPSSTPVPAVSDAAEQSSPAPPVPVASDDAIQSTNTSTMNSSNMSTVESNTTTTALSNVVGSADLTSTSSTEALTNRSSPAFGAFIAEIILISLVGIGLAVMVWTKWRTRAWSRIPDESTRANMSTIVDINETGSLSPTSPPGNPLSPRSRPNRKGPSPKFTIGSSGEEDSEELRDEEEGTSSPKVLGRPQGPQRGRRLDAVDRPQKQHAGVFIADQWGFTCDDMYVDRCSRVEKRGVDGMILWVGVMHSERTVAGSASGDVDSGRCAAHAIALLERGVESSIASALSAR